MANALILLSPAKAGSQIWGRVANPRLKAGGYGSYAGFADGTSCDELNPSRRWFRTNSGNVVVVRTVAPGFEPGVPKRSPRFLSALKRAKERPAPTLANRSAAGPVNSP